MTGARAPLRTTFALACAVTTGACRVVDAPEDLESLAVFALTTFADEDDAAPRAAVDGLVEAVRANREALESGYRIAALSPDDLEALGSPAAATEIVGMAAIVTYTSDPSDVARAWSHPHMDEVLSGTLAFEVVDEAGDRSCFLTGACDTYGLDAERTNDLSLFGVSTQAFTRELRWVTSGVVDADVLVTRDLAPSPAEVTSAFIAIDQQYAYSLFFPDDGGLVRFDAFWVEARVIGVDLPDTFALDLSVTTMARTAEQIDAWIDANP